MLRLVRKFKQTVEFFSGQHNIANEVLSNTTLSVESALRNRLGLTAGSCESNT